MAGDRSFFQFQDKLGVRRTIEAIFMCSIEPWWKYIQHFFLGSLNNCNIDSFSIPMLHRFYECDNLSYVHINIINTPVGLWWTREKCLASPLACICSFGRCAECVMTFEWRAAISTNHFFCRDWVKSVRFDLFVLTSHLWDDGGCFNYDHDCVNKECAMQT